MSAAPRASHSSLPCTRRLKPWGEARSDFEIFRALAARLGYEQAFTDGREEMDWCRSIYDHVRSAAAARDLALPGFQEFWTEGCIELPPPERDFVLFEDFRRDPDRHPLKTPSGRIEIASDTIAGFGYDDCPMHPTWIAPVEWLGSPRAGAWPIHLITHQPRNRLHSQMDPGPASRADKIAGREAIRINPVDAARRNIRDGDVVRVFNDRGACLAGAVLDAGLMPQVAVMATGAWFDPADEANAPERHGNPNVLTCDVGTSRLTQGPSALSALVDIERWTGAATPVKVFEKPPLAVG
jgi:biotin/methionine sulfoxide reductase